MISTLCAFAFAAAMHTIQICNQAAAYDAQITALENEIDGLRYEVESRPVVYIPAEPEIIYLEPEYAECGACGAHVVNWWYAAPYNPDGTINESGEPVPVCAYCYQAILETC